MGVTKYGDAIGKYGDVAGKDGRWRTEKITGYSKIWFGIERPRNIVEDREEGEILTLPSYPSQI